ncbi:MAG: SagB/ThcOx family dehydrogenase [Desulfobacterales bacterium]
MATDDSKDNMLRSDQWDAFQKTETDQKRQIPPPPRQKPHPDNATLIDLVPPENLALGEMSVMEAIRNRRSRRKYTGAPMTPEELAYLLWVTQGISRPFPGDIGALRTAPSGGGRHPFETYLFINHVIGFESGLYRYLPLDHKLCFLYSDAELIDRISAAFYGQYISNCTVAFIWTAIPYRTEWRYGILSPKLIAIDVGHLCQNLYLAVESLSAGMCAIAAYDQDKIDTLLDVDGKEEFAVYLATVGKIN